MLTNFLVFVHHHGFKWSRIRPYKMRKYAINWGTTALRPIHYASKVLSLKRTCILIEITNSANQQSIATYANDTEERKFNFIYHKWKETKKLEAETHAELLRTIPLNQKVTSKNLFYSFGMCDACNDEYEEVSCGVQWVADNKFR